MELLFSQWYIIALQGYERMARLTGDTTEADWAQTTADRARTAFHQNTGTEATTCHLLTRVCPTTARKPLPWLRVHCPTRSIRHCAPSSANNIMPARIWRNTSCKPSA